ncbi:MAG: hypothetical protein V3R96_00305, partial [Dehalococcoidales bacterium]
MCDQIINRVCDTKYIGHTTYNQDTLYGQNCQNCALSPVTAMFVCQSWRLSFISNVAIAYFVAKIDNMALRQTARCYWL